VTRIKLKNIDRFVDRHGKPRYYYRAGKGVRVALPGLPGGPEFMLAYEQAVRGEAAVLPPVKHRGEAGTFDRLVEEYFRSGDFLRLSAASQRPYRLVIERLINDENIGHRLVREMTREHVKRIVARRAETPGAANDVLKKLKILIHFAIDSGWRNDDPTLRVKKYASGEFHTWTEEEIAAFEARWRVGTTGRLAFALLLYTGQRRADVVRMLWSDVKDNAIHVVQGKTKSKLWVPIHPQLGAILAVSGEREGTILKTGFGKPFAPAGFGNFMADRIGQAGLPERCVSHGLRKAASRRLAEAGCSANEIAAITGHQTLKEVSRYTKGAEQKRLARSAMGRLPGAESGIKFPNLDDGFGKSAEKPSDFNVGIAGWRTGQDSNPRPPDS
jgi:enterobacteria phage integrase